MVGPFTPAAQKASTLNVMQALWQKYYKTQQYDIKYQPFTGKSMQLNIFICNILLFKL